MILANLFYLIELLEVRTEKIINHAQFMSFTDFLLETGTVDSDTVYPRFLRVWSKKQSSGSDLATAAGLKRDFNQKLLKRRS